MTAPVRHFIGSAWVGDDTLADSVDPADDSVSQFAAGSAALADQAARVALQTSFASPRATSPRLRPQTLFGIADRFETAKDEIANLCGAGKRKLRSEAMGAVSETRDYAGPARNIRGAIQEAIPDGSRSSIAIPRT